MGEDGETSCVITLITMTDITVAFSDGVFVADEPFELLADTELKSSHSV